MLNMFYDFIPILLFFFAFKFYGIYVATVVGIVATALQVVITTVWKKKLDTKQLVTLGVFVVFGGLTLYFHNPLFVKWKPTVIFWIFGLVFLLSHLIGKKPLIQRMMEKAMESNQKLPDRVWKKMNIAWAVFFILLGTTNLYIAYHFSTDVWVNFKFYGIFGLLVIFSVLQALCLSRYLNEVK
ncbi:MAG: septation protein A [Gammaproteobacteria bacterium]